MMTYDDSRLMQLFEKLSPKNRKKALKGAVTKAANQVRRKAVANLKGSGINTSTGLDKGIRRLVYKTQIGFRVTIGTKTGRKSSGFHRGRNYRRAEARGMSRERLNSMEKPVLLWAEGGTQERTTRTQSRVFRRKRAGHSTGRMPRYAFMERTRQDVTSQVGKMLKDEIVNNIQRIARKYGCSVT